MLKRSGAVARAIVMAGLSCGLVGAVGEAAAQSEGAKKGDGMKNDGMKREDPRQDGAAQKMGDRMGDKMKDDTMMKEKR